MATDFRSLAQGDPGSETGIREINGRFVSDILEIDVNTGEFYIGRKRAKAFAVSPTVIASDNGGTMLRRFEDSDMTAPVNVARSVIRPFGLEAQPSDLRVVIGQYILAVHSGKVSIGEYVEDCSRCNKFDADVMVQGIATRQHHQWDALVPYVIGDIIQHNGVDYLALANSTGINPETDSGVDISTPGHSFEGTKWKRLTVGIAYLSMGGLVKLSGALHFSAFVTAKDALTGTDTDVNTLPARPAGYLNILVNGIPARIPYYASSAGQPPADATCCDCDCCDPQPDSPASSPVIVKSTRKTHDQASVGFKG